MARLVVLTDRSPREALPAVEALGLDVKVEPLSVDSLAHLPDVAPELVLVDAAENPPHAQRILIALDAAGTRLPVVVIVERADVDRLPWHETYQVTSAGRPLDLTYKEFELLKFLAQHPGRVYTRSALLREVWGYDFYGGTRTVDVHIRRLRAKLGPEHEHLIETVRGVGYRAAEAPTDT